MRLLLSCWIKQWNIVACRNILKARAEVFFLFFHLAAYFVIKNVLDMNQGYPAPACVHACFVCDMFLMDFVQLLFVWRLVSVKRP